MAPAYPAAEFYGWLLITARHRYPQLSEEEACREVGRLAVVVGMGSTFLGRAALTAMMLLGVRCSLKRIGSSFKHGNNYIDAKVVELGPTSMEIQLGPLVGPASYYEGVLDEGPRQVGARTVSLTRLRTDIKNVASSMSVITSEMMRDMGATFLMSVRKRVPDSVSFAA